MLTNLQPLLDRYQALQDAKTAYADSLLSTDGRIAFLALCSARDAFERELRTSQDEIMGIVRECLAAETGWDGLQACLNCGEDATGTYCSLCEREYR